MRFPHTSGVHEPVKRHRGEPGHTRDTRTDERTSQPSQPTNAPERPRDDLSGRLNQGLNGRSPGARSRPLPGPRGRLAGRPLRTRT